MESRQIKIGVEMSEDLHRRVKATAASRGMKLKEATNEAFERWLSGSLSSGKVHYSSADRKWIDVLLSILHSGDKDLIHVVQSMLTRLAPPPGPGTDNGDGS